MAYPLLLHGRHGEKAVYETVGEWLAPWRIVSTDAEYQMLRSGVGLIDYSTQALIEVQGADRAAFLHNLLTNDITRLAPGGGCHAALLTANAKLVAELLVIAEAESIWLMCDALRAPAVAQTLERYHFSEAVTITNHERRQAVLAVQGPHTMAALTQLVGGPVALPQPGDHLQATIEGVPVRLIRWSLAREIGVLCLAAAEEAEALWHLLLQQGLAWGMKAVGWEALNIARIEAGVPWFGLDMTEEHLLPETGLEATAVSDTKGCYLGQEVIARLSTYGSVSKRLMGLVVEGTAVPATGDAIVRDGEELGRVTSACQSPALGRPIALGYVKRGGYEPGIRVEILHDSKRLPATVTVRPFLTDSA
ncbi:MAG: aminomethyl transferase family protein [Candidatus Omnitrophica bacterium]|nr:aminomethyl transferase family protein [Candidatus Omnitrophota bacterium]